MQQADPALITASILGETGIGGLTSGQRVYVTVAFEKPLRRRMEGAKVCIRPHHRYLGDYADFMSARPERLDDDFEQATWPDVVDQTGIARACWGDCFDDAEEDDAGGGDICDEPHDARDEDGI